MMGRKYSRDQLGKKNSSNEQKSSKLAGTTKCTEDHSTKRACSCKQHHQKYPNYLQELRELRERRVQEEKNKKKSLEKAEEPSSLAEILSESNKKFINSIQQFSLEHSEVDEKNTNPELHIRTKIGGKFYVRSFQKADGLSILKKIAEVIQKNG